ncbi:hypothetical protein NDU88_001040 [Pleurodeles waltl]|uniref:Uncharacterized protein n=1 Tax=Pleurodeles waltl TaxID=8319 RepID=A0AAV7LZC4_PLEWA|nr:hypothetical protein NDU88_001040 [Pleurodeles waltl]
MVHRAAKNEPRREVRLQPRGRTVRDAGEVHVLYDEGMRVRETEGARDVGLRARGAEDRYQWRRSLWTGRGEYLEPLPQEGGENTCPTSKRRVRWSKDQCLRSGNEGKSWRFGRKR